MAHAAVVLLKLDHLLDTELALEVAHIAHLRASKGVDALVIVAHGKHPLRAVGRAIG